MSKLRNGNMGTSRVEQYLGTCGPEKSKHIHEVKGKVISNALILTFAVKSLSKVS